MDVINSKATKLSIDHNFSGELSEPMVSRVLGETPQVGGLVAFSDKFLHLDQVGSSP